MEGLVRSNPTMTSDMSRSLSADESSSVRGTALPHPHGIYRSQAPSNISLSLSDYHRHSYHRHHAIIMPPPRQRMELHRRVSSVQMNYPMTPRRHRMWSICLHHHLHRLGVPSQCRAPRAPARTTHQLISPLRVELLRATVTAMDIALALAPALAPIQRAHSDTTDHRCRRQLVRALSTH